MRWANDDLRSVNAQIEMLLRRALSEAGRMPKQAAPLAMRGPAGQAGLTLLAPQQPAARRRHTGVGQSGTALRKNTGGTLPVGPPNSCGPPGQRAPGTSPETAAGRGTSPRPGLTD
jgi:hypothetical protein